MGTRKKSCLKISKQIKYPDLSILPFKHFSLECFSYYCQVQLSLPTDRIQSLSKAHCCIVDSMNSLPSLENELIFVWILLLFVMSLLIEQRVSKGSQETLVYCHRCVWTWKKSIASNKHDNFIILTSGWGVLSIGYIAEPSIVIICKCRYVLMNSSNNEVTDYISLFSFSYVLEMALLRSLVLMNLKHTGF